MTLEAREQKRFFPLSKGKEAFSGGWVYRNFKWSNGRCSAHRMGQAHAQTTWQLIEESHLLGFTQGISLWDTSPATSGVQAGQRQLFYYRQWLHTQALGNTQADPEQLTERWQKHVHWCREWHEEMHAGKRERLDFSSFIKIVFWKTKAPRLLPRLLCTGSLGVSFLETQPLGEDSSSASAFHLKVAQG